MFYSFYMAGEISVFYYLWFVKTSNRIMKYEPRIRMLNTDYKDAYLARNSTLLHVIHLSDDFLDILASFLKLE